MMTPDPQRDHLSVPLSLLVIAVLVLVIVGLLGAFALIVDPLKPRDKVIADLQTQIVSLEGEVAAVHRTGATQAANMDALDQKAQTCEATLAENKKSYDSTLAAVRKDLAAAQGEADKQSKRADANLEQCNDRLDRLRRQLGG